MREIKFRYYWEHETGEIWHEEFILDSIEQMSGLMFQSRHSKNLIAKVQYTGLKDKNNKEIYEADRLYDGKGCYRTVHYSIPRGAWYAGTLRLTQKLASILEVHSNTYDNPELVSSPSIKP